MRRASRRSMGPGFHRAGAVPGRRLADRANGHGSHARSVACRTPVRAARRYTARRRRPLQRRHRALAGGRRRPCDRVLAATSKPGSSRRWAAASPDPRTPIHITWEGRNTGSISASPSGGGSERVRQKQQGLPIDVSLKSPPSPGGSPATRPQAANRRPRRRCSARSSPICRAGTASIPRSTGRRQPDARTAGRAAQVARGTDTRGAQPRRAARGASPCRSPTPATNCWRVRCSRSPTR